MTTTTRVGWWVMWGALVLTLAMANMLSGHAVWKEMLTLVVYAPCVPVCLVD